MRVEYEWDVETYDEHGDIIEHDHRSELSRYPSAILSDALCGRSMTRLVLVRDDFRAWGGGARTWAYVDSNGLPRCFSDDWGKTRTKVPKRYRRELAAVTA